MCMQVDGKVQNVTLPKQGPIHDVQWSPLGKEFVCLFGTSPPMAALFDTNCKIIHSFGEAPHNTVCWSPHGRFFILAGFGNMSGELSFYDRKTLRKLSTVDAHMTVAYEWSPCSRFFLTGILFPRLRVDNGYRIWSCGGGRKCRVIRNPHLNCACAARHQIGAVGPSQRRMFVPRVRVCACGVLCLCMCREHARVHNGLAVVHQEKVDELSYVAWRPRLAGTYQEPDEKALTAFAATPAPKPTSLASKYVPPGQRGAGGGGKSLAELAAQGGGGGGQKSGRSLSELAAAVDKGGSAASELPSAIAPPHDPTEGLWTEVT